MLSSMIAIKTWTFVTLFACVVYGQRKPPNYQQNEMPATSFSCKDKIVGGYYADPETSCQMFHVCVSVAGVGVQDFRFLCPNDTAFDQENQICDDWYNIDCEAATLFYSDNFDLYRLGSGGAPVTSGKVTPIPLGPSSASPKIQQPKSRKPSLSAPVNNAVSENDDDYYLQRSDATDSKLQHDLLRGSSSGNFFSSRNLGVENPDDYDDTARVASSKDVPKKNTKAPFRKLLTGKKPVIESSTGASSTTETMQRSTSTTTVRQPNYKPTTYRSKDRGRVNYKTYLDKQTKADEYDFQKVAKPSTQSTTFAPAVSNLYQSTNARVNNVYQTTQATTNVPTYTQSIPNQPKNNDFLRIAPNNNNNNNGFQSTRTNNNNFQSNNVLPANNALLANNAFPANNNNNFQTIQGFQPAINNNANQNFQQKVNFNQGFQSDKIFPTTTQNFNQGGNFQSDKIFSTTQNYNPTTNVVYQTNAYQQGGNTFQPDNAVFQSGNAFQQNNQFQNAGTTTQKYNTYQTPIAYQQSTNVFQSSTPYNSGNSFQQQQTSPQSRFQSTTEHFSKDFKAKFDPYNSYHQRTNEEAGELLKTAPSTNLRPSDLNALIQPKPKSINATLSVGYSFNKVDGGVAKSTVVVPAPTTQKPRPFTTKPVTVAASSSSTTAGTTAFVTTGTSSSTKKAITKDKDSSYDYAYYDDSNHNDYTDVVPEDFSRISKKF